jgi:hypothetical protein
MQMHDVNKLKLAYSSKGANSICLFWHYIEDWYLYIDAGATKTKMYTLTVSHFG